MFGENYPVQANVESTPVLGRSHDLADWKVFPTIGGRLPEYRNYFREPLYESVEVKFNDFVAETNALSWM